MIHGIEGMSTAEVLAEVDRGGRFVTYRYCISVIVLTFRRGTEVHFVRPGESAVMKGLPWTLLTLVGGWWGIPFGPIFSIWCLFENLKGGVDVTDKVVTRR